MNQIEENGSHGTEVAAEPSEQIARVRPPRTDCNSAYLPQNDKMQPSLKGRSRFLAIGAGIVVVLLLLAFNGISRRSATPAKSPVAKVRQSEPQSPVAARTPASVTPILDTGRPPVEDTDGGFVNPDQIGRIASKQPKPIPGATLGSVPPFDNSAQWQPAPFQPETKPADTTESPVVPAGGTATKREHEAMDKASLVFVRNPSSSRAATRLEAPVTAVEWSIGLAPGTRLLARLESAVSTAVRAPAVAVVEYNYEQNGEIVIPAGAKAVGRLEAADRSGHVDIRFDSLMMPGGSSVSLEAAATDLQLQPLRGKVEGTHTGKSILVRSFAGVGEIAATIVGRGSLNQPLSEADLLRERMSNNIGQASDQTVANLELREHTVVSLPAGTEIYLILQKPIKESVHSRRGQEPSQPAGQPTCEELRPLPQLQRELNETSPTKPDQE